MKHIAFFALLFCLVGGSSQAATLSGTLTNFTTCAYVVGQKVYVYDTTRTYQDSTVTNSSGQYSFTLPASLPTNRELYVYTNTSCIGQMKHLILFQGSNLIRNFATCGTQPVVSGIAKVGTSTTNAANMVFYLIHKQYDPVLMDTTLTLVDSSFTGSSPYGYYYFSPTACPGSGTYLVKGALLPAHPNYLSYLPTYYVGGTTAGSVNWSGATNVPTSGANYNKDFSMVAGVNPGGPAFIGGSVLVGANKTTGVGDPIPGRILILTTNANVPVAYTYTDATGKFRFSNIPYGSYKLFGDAPGKTNPALAVTVSAAQPSVGNIFFDENNKTFRGRIGGLGTGGHPALAGVAVFPNPATDFVTVSGLDGISGSKTVVLTNITGGEISRQTITKGDAKASTAALPAGIYLLQVQTESGSASFRIVK